MNIKEAKNQIRNTLKAYLKKDELGNYRIPSVRQRPVLLIGPPGIGKTQIMEQIASEENVGLVAYTITHHTRQSAIGLPIIEKRVFNGTEYTVTEYTMSEIIGSVYALMEKTGIKEGILFLDEINCVSETLAPMMLQFLQCKTFGNQKLPEGWMIVAAGNPPEYNKSVRDFDIVTLDRVKRINVEEDYSVWKEYAVRNGIHAAIISYIDTKKDNFYSIEMGADGLQFATARGWEDLSEIIYTYEEMDIPVDTQVIIQYIQLPAIARDFANYLALYYKYRQVYHVDDILEGAWPVVTESEFRSSAFDEKLAVMSMMYSRLADSSKKAHVQDGLTAGLYEIFSDIKSQLDEKPAGELIKNAADSLRLELRRASDAGHDDKDRRNLMQMELAVLDSFVAADNDEAMDLIRQRFNDELEKGKQLADETGRKMDNAFDFLEKAIGQSQELVFFVTQITSGYDTSWYVSEFGCDAYFRHNKELLFSDTRKKIIEKIRGSQ